jgi:hypothetical protein
MSVVPWQSRGKGGGKIVEILLYIFDREKIPFSYWFDNVFVTVTVDIYHLVNGLITYF